MMRFAVELRMPYRSVLRGVHVGFRGVHQLGRLFFNDLGRVLLSGL